MVVKLKKKLKSKTKRLANKPRDLCFRNIGGYDRVKQEIRDAIVIPMRHPSLFKELGIKAPKGILLWGAPGVGKTLFARSIASECNASFYHVRAADIMSEWFGVSERRVKELFHKAKRGKPSIVFFDELESLAPNRQFMAIEDGRTSLLASLLSELDGFEPLHQVTVIAATNIPNRLDPALLRPGRFDRLIYIPLPNQAERKQILEILLARKPLEHIDVQVLAERTRNFSGADLEFLVNSATTNWLKRYIENRKEVLSLVYFEGALKNFKPSVRPEELRYYESLRNAYERTGGVASTFTFPVTTSAQAAVSTLTRSDNTPSYYG